LQRIACESARSRGVSNYDYHGRRDVIELCEGIVATGKPIQANRCRRSLARCFPSRSQEAGVTSHRPGIAPGAAETLLRNLARHLEKDWEGVSASILEGLDEMLTVTTCAEVAIPPVPQTHAALGLPDLAPPLREDVRDIDGLAAPCFAQAKRAIRLHRTTV
jgi:plasmid stabilization system protein ParE